MRGQLCKCAHTSSQRQRAGRGRAPRRSTRWTNTGKGSLLRKGDPDLNLSPSLGSRAQDQAGGSHHGTTAEWGFRGAELPTPSLRPIPHWSTDCGPRNMHSPGAAPALLMDGLGEQWVPDQRGPESTRQGRAGAAPGREEQVPRRQWAGRGGPADSEVPADRGNGGVTCLATGDGCSVQERMGSGWGLSEGRKQGDR